MATLADLEAELTAARECKLAILRGGQSKSARGKSLAYPSLDAVDKAITRLEKEIAAKSGRSSVVTSRHGFR